MARATSPFSRYVELPLPRLLPRPRVSACVAVLAVACGSQDARTGTKFASDFAPAGHVVSVLGVFKDGQMNVDAWETMSPKIAPSLGAHGAGDATDCAAGYSEAMRSDHAELTSAIDDYARSDGPTDELLAQIAPAARGDLIVVVTFAGKLPVAQSKPTVATNSGPMGVGQSGSRRTGGPGGGRRASRPSSAPSDPNELDISATLFSVAQGRSVGQIAMQYTGESVDDALTQFAAQLRQALPQARCEGWDWTAKIDPDHLRQMIDQ
jgi:hypothetical protein